MRNLICRAFLLTFVTLSFATGVFAQDDRPATTKAATAPSTLPADAKVLNAKIISVKGVVKVRQAEEKPWILGKVGMLLDQGSELQTGLRSAVQIFIEPDQTITLDRLGTVKLLQLFLNQGKVTTDLGMKYGRTQYDIKATDLEHQSTIRSPGSTLAIRGTNVVYEDQAPWQPNAISRTGRAQFRNYRREFLAFGGNKRAAVATDNDSPAQNAVDKTKVDPRGKFAGRTDSESELLVTLSSNGGADAQVLQALDIIRGGAIAPDTTDTNTIVPGPLHFELSWLTAQGAGPADLNLVVTDPLRNIASALNPIVGTGSATGVHGGNDAGLEGFGVEFVEWSVFFPKGTYKLEAVHVSGADATITLQAVQGSKQIKVFGDDPNAPIVLKAGETFTGTVTSEDPSIPALAAQKRNRRNAARETTNPKPTAKVNVAPGRKR